jgi:hypothetical protein
MRLMAWLFGEPRQRQLNEACRNCGHFSDFSEEDPEEPTGYCCHPFHSTWKSPHSAYGGHWAESYGWCDMWEAADVAANQDSAPAVLEPPAKQELTTRAEVFSSSCFSVRDDPDE